MPKKYAIEINEKNLDLIEFLNDGVRPLLEKKSTFFIFEVNSPREITAKIEFGNELYNENGLIKDKELTFLVL